MDKSVFYTGFLIIIVGLIVFIYLPFYIGGLNDELYNLEEDWDFYYNNDMFDLYYSMENKLKDDIEVAGIIWWAMPLIIILGVVGMFLGYFEPFSQKEIQKKKEHKKQKEENVEVLKILNTRYAKGEITKEEYELKKKDMFN